MTGACTGDVHGTPSAYAVGCRCGTPPAGCRRRTPPLPQGRPPMTTLRALAARLWDAAQHAAGWLWAQLTAPGWRLQAVLDDANDVWPDDIADQLPERAREIAELDAAWLLPAYVRPNAKEKP